jgi:hypothetical protein
MKNHLEVANKCDAQGLCSSKVDKEDHEPQTIKLARLMLLDTRYPPYAVTHLFGHY